MNIFFVDGNLTDDPIDHGTRCTFNIAHNYFKNETKQVTYFRCVCFIEGLVKGITANLNKGDKVFLKGFLQESEHEGKKYYSINVNYYAIQYKKNVNNIPF